MNVSNDGVHHSVMNVTYELFFTIQQMRIAVTIFLPEDENDTRYRRVFLRSTIDVNRMLKNMEGSFFVKALMENFLKSIDFPPQLPLGPVRNQVSSKIRHSY